MGYFVPPFVVEVGALCRSALLAFFILRSVVLYFVR